MKGNFDKTLGTGTQRTGYELWRNMKPLTNKYGIELKKIEIGIGKSLFKRKISFILTMPFHNFNEYDIVHSLIAIPNKPPITKHTKLLTSVNELVILEKESIPYKVLVEGRISKLNMLSFFNKILSERIKKQILASDYLSVNSTQTRDEILTLGYPKERVFIINHGIDERFLTKIPKKKNPKFKVGYVGALNTRKNLSLAIDAFKRIKSADIEFEIWGKPVLEYNKLLNQTEEDKRIKFMGFAPEEKLVSIYDRFDAFVFPSLYEGFGLPIIEAQSRGLPVVLYNEGKIPKEVKKYCFMAKNSAEISKILINLKEKGYNTNLKKRATDYARKFTRKKEATDTLNLYLKLYSLNH